MGLRSKIEQFLKTGRNAGKENKPDSMAVEMVCTTNTGNIRNHNEDNIAVNQIVLPIDHQSIKKPIKVQKRMDECPFAAVFDGMGGEFGGEIASYAAAKYFAAYENETPWNVGKILDLVSEMNQVVVKLGKEHRARQMGTTFSGIFCGEEDVFLSNLGDSPVYRYRLGVLEEMYEAHTNEAFLKRQGINRKPGLTQFLGIYEEGMVIEPYVTRVEIEENDIFLLCSDGLTDMVEEKRICEIIEESANLTECVQGLEMEALRNGGKDNITILLCKVKRV